MRSRCAIILSIDPNNFGLGIINRLKHILFLWIKKSIEEGRIAHEKIIDTSMFEVPRFISGV